MRLGNDYIALTKHFFTVSKTVRQQIELRLRKFSPKIPTEDSADQTWTYVAFQTLEKESDILSIRYLFWTLDPSLF